MKKIGLFIITLIFFSNINSFAQDTIFFRNGDELLVKVTEVSDAEIKYILWSYLCEEKIRY